MSDGTTAPARCLVYCRLRPDNSRDYEDGGSKLLTLKGKQVMVEDERNYDFDGTFDQGCKQEDIFNGVALPCLQHAFKGFCSALMCYGQTGTGKSFTMCCTKPGIEGIIPRSANFIFDPASREPGRTYTVTGQFVQIYRDQLGDLMTEGGKDKVDIRFEKDEGVTLPGCSSHVLTSPEEFMKFYDEGNSRRVVTATAMNPESSRGHSALIIWVCSTGEDNTERKGKITFIDLAGYERFSKTGISNANVVMKDEAKTINASLLSLGHVVSALSNGDKHVPWRNAKLTRLLQDSIGGRSRTTIILTVGPSSDHLHETTNSLQFGMRAMAVKVEAKISVTVDYQKLAAKLQDMLDEKDKKINSLEVQVEASNADKQALLERQRRDEEQMRQRHEEEILRLKEEGATGERIVKVTHQQQVEAQGLQEEHREEVQYLDEAANREMVAAVQEQSRKAQMRQKEMELAQDRLVKDFERKLEEAREGGNSDMLSLMKQLGDKDTALVSRAQQVAELDMRVQQLLEQMREAGMEPEEEEEAEKTYLDFVQVEEMRKRYEAELESKQATLLEATTQLDRIEDICKNRGEEIDRLTAAHDSLRAELEEAGLTIKTTESELNTVRTGMVDQVEVEHMKYEMQSEIDRLNRLTETLSSDLDEAKTKLKEAEKRPQRQRSVSMLKVESTVKNDSMSEAPAEENLDGTTTSLVPKGMGLGLNLASLPQNNDSIVLPSARGGMSVPMSARPGVADAGSIALMRQQINALHEEILGLSTKNEKLSELLDSHNVPVPPGMRTEDPDPDVQQESPRMTEVRKIVHLQEGENSEAYALVAKLEASLKSSDDRRRALEHHNKKLQREITALGGKIPSDTQQITPSIGFPMEQFERVLENLREQNRELQAKLLKSSKRNNDEPEEESTEIDTVANILKVKDQRIATLEQESLKDKATIQHIGNLFISLSTQLNELGQEPSCHLPEDVQASVDAEAEIKEKENQQRQAEMKQLQADQAHREEKLKGMLANVGAERAKDASMFESYQANLEAELEEQKAKAEKLEQERHDAELQLIEAKRIRFEAEQKQLELDAALAENTKAMMAAQAQQLHEDPEEEQGFFKKLFGKKKK